MLIRTADVTDARAIASVHVQVWNETYRGIMPDSMLDALNVETRAQTWAARIPTFRDNRQTLMIAEDAGVIVGFAGCGPRRNEKLGADGEIYMINILRSAMRRRTGTHLMLTMARALEADSFAQAGLWVLEKNLKARAFYERLGGTPGVVTHEEHDGVVLTDLAILWPRIATLRERAADVIARTP